MRKKVLGLMLAIVCALSVNSFVWAFPSLPSYSVGITVVYGSSSYFLTTVSGIQDQHPTFDVENIQYAGWCLDKAHIMSRGVLLQVTMWSSLSLQGYNKVNYVLNHKVGSKDDVQRAIWCLTNWTSYASLSKYAKSMVTNANGNSTFVPGLGEIVAVILKPLDCKQQLSLIEVVQEPLRTRLGIVARGAYLDCITLRVQLTAVDHDGAPEPIVGANVTVQVWTCRGSLQFTGKVLSGFTNSLGILTLIHDDGRLQWAYRYFAIYSGNAVYLPSTAWSNIVTYS